jgi:signal peptidase
MIVKNFGRIVFIIVCIVSFELGFFLAVAMPGRMMSLWKEARNFLGGIEISREKIPMLFIVQSGSMEPAIKTGSVVVVIPKKRYYVGEIVTYDMGGGKKKNLVTHRIKESVGENEFRTKGDANGDLDPKIIGDSQIVGKVVFSIPYLGYIAGFAKSPKGFILLVIVPSTIIIYEELKFLMSEVIRKTSQIAKIKLKIRKKEKYVNLGVDQDIFPYSNLTERLGMAVKIYAIIPLLGLILLLAAYSIGFFSDREVSSGNVFGASDIANSSPSDNPSEE